MHGRRCILKQRAFGAHGKKEAKAGIIVGMLVTVAAGLAVLLLTYRTSPRPVESVPDGRQAEYGRIETSRDIIRFISFSRDSDVIVLAIQNKSPHPAGRLFILLDRFARNALRAAMQKYKTWKKIARRKAANRSKTMTTLELTQLSYENGRWLYESNLDISIVFASPAFVGANSRDFFNAEPSYAAVSSFLIAYGRNNVALNDDQAKAFSNLLQEEAVNRGSREAMEKQEAIDILD